MFAKIGCPYCLGSNFVRHAFTAPIFGRSGGVFAPGSALVSFGDSTSRKWPHVFEPVGGGAFICSERIADQIRGCGFSGIDIYPVEIGNVASIWLEKKKPPAYFWARISGEVPVRIFKDGIEVFANPDSGLIEFAPGVFTLSHIRIKFDPRDWDGSDFFRILNMYHGMRFCSQRVIEAATKFQWPDMIFARTNEHVELNF